MAFAQDEELTINGWLEQGRRACLKFFIAINIFDRYKGVAKFKHLQILADTHSFPCRTGSFACRQHAPYGATTSLPISRSLTWPKETTYFSWDWTYSHSSKDKLHTWMGCCNFLHSDWKQWPFVHDKTLSFTKIKLHWWSHASNTLSLNFRNSITTIERNLNETTIPETSFLCSPPILIPQFIIVDPETTETWYCGHPSVTNPCHLAVPMSITSNFSGFK